ncbi:MAG: hypothetical protein LJE95_09680 [Acidobacteria bacterium]|nr:hypothetical protein [Acidobacteriota bacterium]
MRERLTKLYVSLLAPAIVLFAVLYVVKKLAVVDTQRVLEAVPALAPLIFVLAVVCAVASPLLFRTAFVYNHRDSKSIGEDEFYRLQRRTLTTALVAPYLAVVAAFLGLPSVPFTGTALAAFYAVYYFYPSEKKMRRETRIFRVK